MATLLATPEWYGVVMSRRTHGSGSVYRLPTGVYRAACELPPDPATGARRRLTAKGRTKAKALARLKEKKLEYERTGKLGSAVTPMLSDWLDRWLTEIVAPKLRPSTVATYRSVVEADIKPAIGGVRIGRLEPRHFRMLEEFIVKGDETAGRRPKSTATAGSAWRTLHKALDDAVREGMLDNNPCDRAEAPRVVYKERKILSPAQAGQLIRLETDPLWHLMWRLMFETGMRQAERFALMPEELVMVDGRLCITVEWQLKVFSNVKKASDIPADLGARLIAGKAWLVPPKTARGRRLIPLPDSLASELKCYMGAHALSHGLVFSQADGSPLNRMIETRAWKAALERAELPNDFVPHSARHTAATALARLGMSDKVRESVMGHTVDVSNKVYVHVGVDELAMATAGLETAIDGV